MSPYMGPRQTWSSDLWTDEYRKGAAGRNIGAQEAAASSGSQAIICLCPVSILTTSYHTIHPFQCSPYHTIPICLNTHHNIPYNKHLSQLEDQPAFGRLTSSSCGGLGDRRDPDTSDDSPRACGARLGLEISLWIFLKILNFFEFFYIFWKFWIFLNF